MMRCLTRALLAGLLSGCTAMNGGYGAGGDVRPLYAASMCGSGTRQARLTWIDDARQLQRFSDRITGRRPSVPLQVDFATRAVVLVEMGAAPSAGYGLSLQDRRAAVAGGYLTLYIKWLEPAPERVYAQVVTHPCLLVSVPRGAYHRLRVRDQRGVVRLQLRLPGRP